jgi:hypothetical protein
MKLEKALPLLRKGKSIKRVKKSSIMIVNLNLGKYLGCKSLFNSGEEFNDTYYKFTNEDLLADNWEVVE